MANTLAPRTPAGPAERQPKRSAILCMVLGSEAAADDHAEARAGRGRADLVRDRAHGSREQRSHGGGAVRVARRHARPPIRSRPAASSSRAKSWRRRSARRSRRRCSSASSHRSPKRAGLHRLRNADPQQLGNMLRGEHPQTVALILAHLEAAAHGIRAQGARPGSSAPKSFCAWRGWRRSRPTCSCCIERSILTETDLRRHRD